MWRFTALRPHTSRAAGAAMLIALLVQSGCSGGGSSSGNGVAPTAQTYSLSGTVSGLDSSGLVLMVNAERLRRVAYPSDYATNPFGREPMVKGLGASGHVLMVNATAVSVAAGKTTQGLVRSLPSGTSYSVTVQTQPTGETCTVAGGTGTIQSANVANVVVTCSNQAYSLQGHDQRLEWLGSGAGKRHRYACRELGSHELYDAHAGRLHQQLWAHRTDAAGGFGLCGWQRHGHHAGQCGDERCHHLHRSTLQPRGHDQRSRQQRGAHAHQWQRYARGCRRQHQLHDAHTGCLRQPLLSCGADGPGRASPARRATPPRRCRPATSPASSSPARISRTPWAARSAGSPAAAWCWSMAAIRSR